MAYAYICDTLLPVCRGVGLDLELTKTQIYYKLRHRGTTPPRVYLRIRVKTNEMYTPNNPACVCGLYDEGAWGPRITRNRFIRILTNK
jgi:hypothetical protein